MGVNFPPRLVFSLLVALANLGIVRAQIPVGLFGTPPITFSSNVTLLPTEWATSTNGLGNFSSASLTNPAHVEAAVQAFDQSAFSMPLPTTISDGSSRYARHNTRAEYLYTLPAGIDGVLKATLRNVSGVGIHAMTISYDFARPDVSTANFEEMPGYRVFFSMSGLPGDWQTIPELSGVFIGSPLSAILELGFWAPGANMYLLWVDDNGMVNPDGYNSIDNFAVTDVIHGDPSPLTITNSPQSTNVAERGSVTFGVGVDGSPRKFFWFSNQVQVAGNNQASFTIASASYEENNAAEIYVVVSNALMVVTSTPAILTVIPDTVPPAVVSVIGELDPTRVTVTFSEAMDPFVSEANFTVFPTGGDPFGPEALLTTGFLFNSNNTSVIITTDPRVPGSNYSLRLTELYDASSQYNLITPNPTVMPVQPLVQLIGFDTDNEWKWDLNKGDRFGTGWETVGYDDSAWPSGSAGLGLDASANGIPIRTTLPFMADSAPAYFRRHFFLPSATNRVTLMLRHVIEDGAVYYINGQEAARFRVAPATLTFASRASAAAPEPAPIEGPFVLPTTNLVSGDNVIAVVVLQSGATSSDIEFAAELTARIDFYPEGPPPPPPLPNQTVVEGHSVTFSIYAEGAVPIYYQWRKGGQDIPGATNSSYVISPVLPMHAGLYSVFVSNAWGSVESAPAILIVIPRDPPHFLSAIGHTNLTNITLSFSASLDLESAQNISHYSVQNPPGQLEILSATLTNGTNVLLVTSPRVPLQTYRVVLNGVTDDSVAANLPQPGERLLSSEMVILGPNGTILWRFNQTSNDLGSAWRDVGYDDAEPGWDAGSGGLSSLGEVMPAGFEIRTPTLLAMTNGGPNTIYFRAHFPFPGHTNNARLYAAGVVDDGAVFYINGAEAGRIRMTNNPVLFGSLASEPSPENADVHVADAFIPLKTDNIVPFGDNLLAVEVHQSGISSDVVLSLQLIAGLEQMNYSFPVLRISQDPGSGQITIRWSGQATLRQADELVVGGLWSGVPGNPNPYVFTPAPNSKRFFRLVP